MSFVKSTPSHIHVETTTLIYALFLKLLGSTMYAISSLQMLSQLSIRLWSRTLVLCLHFAKIFSRDDIQYIKASLYISDVSRVVSFMVQSASFSYCIASMNKFDLSMETTEDLLSERHNCYENIYH